MVTDSRLLITDSGMYHYSYLSNNKDRKPRTIDITKINSADFINEINLAAKEANPYESIVYNAVKMNPKGNITDIYMDIISNGMFQLQSNKVFNEKYHVNYHRSYLAINGKEYNYGKEEEKPSSMKKKQQKNEPAVESISCSGCPS